MIPDPIVEEVRQHRDDYARQFNYDAMAIFRDLQKRQQARARKGRKLVSFAPKRPTTAAKRPRRTKAKR